MYYSESCYRIHDWLPTVYIAQAWMVVEKMKESSWWLHLYQYASKSGPWRAVFQFGGMSVSRKLVYVESDTAPMAICLASLDALKAKE